MRFRWWLWLLFAIPAFAQAGELPVPTRTFRLANGLTVLMAPDSEATTVDVAVWYPAGTRYERAGATGLTHLFDGLMFGGSRNFPHGEHQRLLLGEGATINTFTTPDYSCFFENLPPQALEIALRLEADRMSSLILTQQSLDAARAGVRDERRGSAENSPLGRGVQKLFATAFAGHAYRWPTVGLAGDLDRITLAECLAYYRERYAPNGALLTLVGRMDPTYAEGRVRFIFGALPRRGAGTRPSAPVRQSAQQHASGVSAMQVPLLFAGWRTPPDSDADQPALDLLARILTRGTNSRLQQALVTEGHLGLAARGGFDSRREAGLLQAIAAVRPEADTSAVERALVEEVEKLASEGVTAQECDQAKREAEAEQLFGWQTTRGLAQSLGSAQMVDGDFRAAASRLERLRQLTPEDLQKAAARSLTAENRTIVWMHPGGDSEPQIRPVPEPAPVRRARATKKGGR